MVTAGAKGTGTAQIQTDLSDIRSKGMGYSDTVFKGVGQPGVKLLIQGKIVFKVKTIILCCIPDL